MTEVLRYNHKENSLQVLAISVFLHVALFVAFVYLFDVSPASSGGGGYVEVSAADIGPPGNAPVPQSVPVEEPVKKSAPVSDELVEKVASEDKVVPEEGSQAPSLMKGSAVNSGRYSNFSAGTGDTTSLQQIYSEKTLNVRIGYPTGWTFLDQTQKNKLDGVTFWAANGAFDPPPYIFLEVKEKYLFNPSQYKHSTKMNNSTVYYNDPVELENQVSQVFYFRTDSGEDFSLKLIMKGREAFSAFQPVFFGMIKTFRFGNSLF